MKKSVILATTAGIISVLLFASCAFGFEPAWKGKAGKATLSLRFNTIADLARADSSDRAVIQGDGYLYIRTLGGPKSTSGPFYGPYHLKPGEKFETTDIPPGTYTNIGFLLAAANIDSEKATYNGKEYTFRKLMSLPDDDFNAMTDMNESSTETESPFNEILDGNASGKLLDKVTIKEGTVNSLKMTMEPMTGSKSQLRLNETNSLILTSDGSTLVRKFIKLEGYGDSYGVTVTEGKFSIVPDAKAYIGKIKMYTELGSPLTSFEETTVSGVPRTFKFARTPDTSYFIYMEYIAESIKIDVVANTLSTSTLKVELLGDPVVAGKRMFVGLHDSDVNGNMIGKAIFTIAADGKASGLMYAVGSSEPIQLPIGGTYYLSTFIDFNNNYASITEASPVSEYEYMMPHYADYSTPDKYKPVTINVPGKTYQYLWAALEMNDSYVYFISSSGVGTGETPANACTLSTALINANNNAPYFTQIFLTSPVTVSSTLPPISAEVVISSLGATRQTMTVDPTPFFSLTSGAICTLNNIIVDGENMSRTNSLVTSIPAAATFNLTEGSTITRFSGATNGGAIAVSGGELNLTGGEISYCTAGGSGGAIILGSGTVNLESGSIHHNYANFGGGISEQGGTLIIAGTTTINNNTAGNRGGGISCLAGDLTLSESATITNNTAGSRGAGIDIEGGTNFTVSSILSCITGNNVTANDPNSGAGVYCVGIAAANAAFTSAAYVTGNTYLSGTSNIYY